MSGVRKPHAVTVLAFDFGEKYVGVAVGNTESGTASPIGWAKTGGYREIDAWVCEWQPQRLVVGLPTSSDGAPHATSARCRKFARRLGARYRLAVEFADERYSSTAAEETLRSIGRGARKDKHLVHAEAARVVLQAYLDEHRTA